MAVLTLRHTRHTTPHVPYNFCRFLYIRLSLRLVSSSIYLLPFPPAPATEISHLVSEKEGENKEHGQRMHFTHTSCLQHPGAHFRNGMSLAHKGSVAIKRVCVGRGGGAYAS